MSIRSLNSDRGSEFEVLDNFCKENSILHIYTMPYKPQQNGIAKKRNRTSIRYDEINDDTCRSFHTFLERSIINYNLYIE